MMPCQHTFCLECLEEQLDYSNNDGKRHCHKRILSTSLPPIFFPGKVITCPLCKLTVVDSVPRNLPTNLYIDNLLRVMGNSGESLDHLVMNSPIVTFAPFDDQPNTLIKGSSLQYNQVESLGQETRCVKCETACTKENKCKHCKQASEKAFRRLSSSPWSRFSNSWIYFSQIFCSVCWVAHMDELKEQLGNIIEQLHNTTDRFDHRIQDFKARVVQLTDYIDRDIELRIGELRQEREERIKRAEESAKKGERLADDLKRKIMKTQEDVDAHRSFKFDSLADNQEKVSSRRPCCGEIET